MQEFSVLEEPMSSFRSMDDIILAIDLEEKLDDLAVIVTIRSFLEENSIDIQRLIDNNIVNHLVNLLENGNDEVIYDLLDLLVLIYELSDSDQRSVLADIGIHSVLINRLTNISSDLIPHILFLSSYIASISLEEQENFSNNEIWPTIETIINNYQEDRAIIKQTSILLVQLLKPHNGKSLDFMYICSITDSLIQLCDHYVDIFNLNEEESKDVVTIILNNIFIILSLITQPNSSIRDYYDSIISPFVDGLIPLLINFITSHTSVPCLKTLSNLAVSSSTACAVMVDEGLLDALDIMLQLTEKEDVMVMPKAYTRWLVLFIVSNIAAGNEDNCQKILECNLFGNINKMIVDKNRNSGLFKEFVFFISNLIFSANNQQKETIAHSGVLRVMLGILEKCEDDEVCTVAATAAQLLVDNGIRVDLKDILQINDINYCASSIVYDLYDSVSLS